MKKLARSRRSPSPPPEAPPGDTKTQVSPAVGDPAVGTGPTETPAGTPAQTPADPPAAPAGPGGLRALLPAAHPRLALLVAIGMTVGAVCAGREPREIALVLATVLVGQAVLGWHNDLVDRERDREHRVPGKPLAEGRLEPGTVWFAIACGVLLLIPLGVTNGITAGSAYLVAVLVGILGNVVLRTGLLSWVTWAASYALLPAFLSYGGWGGQAEGDPPRVAITVLAGVLGIGMHLVTAVWGLEPDSAGGWRTLPLRLGRRLGSSGLLLLGTAWVVASLVAIGVTAASGGLSR